MALQFKTIAAAKQDAKSYAKRDGCVWHVYTHNISRVWPYQIISEFQNFDARVFGDKKIASYGPDQIPIVFTRAEAELVEYILRDGEGELPAESDTPKVRRSVWEKVKKFLSS